MAAGRLTKLQPPPVPTSEITLPSFAKINWSLHVFGKRADGYHEVSTVLQTVSLHDELHFVRRDDAQIQLSCDDPDLPTDESNLIVRAARLLQNTFRLGSGAEIHLEKRIPTRAGLGGASANAAITLLGLNYLWQLETDISKLFEFGNQLGADVPFFLVGGRVLATGIGNTLTALSDSADSKLLIVTPNAKISTAEAYSRLKASALTTTNPDPILTSSRVEALLLESDQWVLHNDFENVIFETEPEIKRVHEALLDAGARGVLLAGSGSSVFGIFDNAEAQGRALEEIQTENGWRIFPCETLSHSEYLRAMGPCGTPLLRSSITRFNSGA